MKATRTPRPLTGPAERGGGYSISVWVALAAGAFLLRGLYLAELRHTPFFSVLVGDGQQYDAWAQRIAAGDWVGTGVFYQTPLYPYLLAIVFKIAGHQVFLVRVLQAALGSASCLLLAFAGQRLFGRRAGFIAGVLLAISPSAIFFDGLIQKSSLDLFLLTGLFAALAAFRDATRRRWLVMAGTALGLLMLNRENARVLYPVVIVWVLTAFRHETLRRRATWTAIVTACVAMVLVPVGVRNAVAGGEFMVSTSQLGPNFYIGNHTGAQGSYEPLVEGHGHAGREQSDARQIAEAASHSTLTSGQVSSYWLSRALSEIRQQPRSWLQLMGRKLLLTFNAGELVDTESIAEYARYSMVLRIASWTGFGVLLPVAVIGMWITRRDWRRLVLLYTTIAAMAVSVAAFYVLSRYRFPIEPLLMLFAGAALAALPRVSIDWRDWTPGLMAAAGIAMVAHIPMTPAWGGTHYNVGSELVRLGRPSEAIPLLQAAVAIDPADASAHYNLGLAYQRIGDPDRSIGSLQTATRLRPADVDTRQALAAVLRADGRHDEAMAELKHGVDLQPQSARAHLNYGVALWQAGQRDRALTEYELAARLEPDDATARNNFGAALQQLGRTSEAVAEYHAALANNPDYAEAHANLALALAETANPDGAREHFTAALRLQPDNFGLHANYAEFLHRQGRVDDAIGEYEHAIALAQAAGRHDDAEQLAKALRALTGVRHHS